MSQYSPLTRHLQRCPQAEVAMRFVKIEAVLGSALPPSSRQDRGWWSNNPINTVMTKAWLAADYTTRNVDLSGEQLVFAKSTAAPAPAPATGFSEGGAGVGTFAKLPMGDHPLFGCMAGTVRVEPGCDLTGPLYGDAEVDGWFDQKVTFLRGARP